MAPGPLLEDREARYGLGRYLTTPFLLAMDGVHVEEVEPWQEGAETWHVLRV
jgi:hypothetical protein